MASREVGGPRLVNALCVLGYEATQQKGSHVRVTTQRDEANHQVIPVGHVIKAGTLSGILRHVATHHRMSMSDLLKMLSL
jgi:predicted RNA binding protein YcfA (HicA-like mRNA interferase family)